MRGRHERDPTENYQKRIQPCHISLIIKSPSRGACPCAEDVEDGITIRINKSIDVLIVLKCCRHVDNPSQSSSYWDMYLWGIIHSPNLKRLDSAYFFISRVSGSSQLSYPNMVSSSLELHSCLDLLHNRHDPFPTHSLHFVHEFPTVMQSLDVIPSTDRFAIDENVGYCSPTCGFEQGVLESRTEIFEIKLYYVRGWCDVVEVEEDVLRESQYEALYG